MPPPFSRRRRMPTPIILIASSAARRSSFSDSAIASSSVQGRLRMLAKASIPCSKLIRTLPAPDRAGQRDHRNAASPRLARDFGRNLAERGLLVEAAFGGDDQIGPAQHGLEGKISHDDVIARVERRAQQRMQPCAEPAGGATTGSSRDIPAGGRMQPVGIGFERRLQHLHLLGARSLLRGEDAGDATRAEQHIMPVDRCVDPDGVQAWVAPGEIDAGQPAERRAAPADRRAFGVEQTHPQGLRHAGAAIIDAAVAAAEQDALSPGIQRRCDQLADAVAGRQRRVAPVSRDQRQAGRSRHLDHRRLRAGSTEEAEMRCDRIADRPGHLALVQDAAGHGAERPRENLLHHRPAAPASFWPAASPS
jgi:hypothetical protein